MMNDTTGRFITLLKSINAALEGDKDEQKIEEVSRLISDFVRTLPEEVQGEFYANLAIESLEKSRA